MNELEDLLRNAYAVASGLLHHRLFDLRAVNALERTVRAALARPGLASRLCGAFGSFFTDLAEVGEVLPGDLDKGDQANRRAEGGGGGGGRGGKGGNGGRGGKGGRGGGRGK